MCLSLIIIFFLQLLDFWSSHEKAQYPEYFALRDIRKKEFIERWEKQYGKTDSEVSH